MFRAQLNRSDTAVARNDGGEEEEEHASSSWREPLDTSLKWAQLAIAIGLLMFAPAAFGAVRAREFVVIQWGILALASLWVVRLWVQAPFRFLLPPAAWAILPFITYAGWRYSTADTEFLARQEFIQISLLGLYLFVLINNLHGQNVLRYIAYALITTATLLSMYAGIQWLTKSQSVFGYQGYYGRGSGSFICPNHFSGFVEMCLPLALALVLTGRLKILPRIFLAYAAAMMCVGIAVSGSRGGWVSIAIAVLFFVGVLITRRGFRWQAIIAALVVASTGYWLYSKAMAFRAANTFLTGHEKENRFWIWESALKMWQDHPLWGVGPAHFDDRYRAYRAEQDKTQSRPGYAHNDYLNTLAEYGVVGLALALLPLGVVGWSAVRVWPSLQSSSRDLKNRESNRAAMALGAGCGLIAILVHSLFDFNLHIPANALTAVTISGILISQVRFSTSRWWKTARWPLRIGATVVLTVVIAALARQALSRTREAVAFSQAQKAKPGSPAQFDAYRRAMAAEPKDPEAAFQLGEHLKAMAFTGETGYQQFARDAIAAYELCIQLNRWYPLSYIGAGMCLDWLEKHDEALPYFKKAVELDPNYFYTREMMAWHYFQADDLANAEIWNNKSLSVNWLFNPHADMYRRYIQEAKKAAEARGGK